MRGPWIWSRPPALTPEEIQALERAKQEHDQQVKAVIGEMQEALYDRNLPLAWRIRAANPDVLNAFESLPNYPESWRRVKKGKK